MVKFGNIFERYVNGSIDRMEVEYLSERDLKNKYPNQKTVDFIIKNTNGNIFIDAKGVELSYLGMVSNRPDVVAQKTKSSIIKGLEQAYSLIEFLIGESDIVNAKISNYLILITYKDLYLGQGIDFYHNIARKQVDKLIRKYKSSDYLPIENVFIMSIEDFDVLAESIIKYENDLVVFLNKVKEREKSSMTKRFFIRQHLFEDYPELRFAEFLNDKFEFVMSNLSRYLEHTKK